MAKLPAFAKAFAGRWRIVEMEVWNKDFLDPSRRRWEKRKTMTDYSAALGPRR